MQPRTTNVTSSLPSGPRNVQPQPQPPPPRDSNHPELARGSRQPPSGPSAAPTRPRHRVSNDNLSFSEGQHYRDREADVDVPSQYRSQQSAVNDAPVKNAGMYADREPGIDGLPTGPRTRARNSAHPNAFSVTSISPAASFAPHHPQSNQMQIDVRRSPPPHQPAGERWDQGAPAQQRQQPQASGAAQGEEESPWVPDLPRDRGHVGVGNPRHGTGYASARDYHASHFLISHLFPLLFSFRGGKSNTDLDGNRKFPILTLEHFIQRCRELTMSPLAENQINLSRVIRLTNHQVHPETPTRPAAMLSLDAIGLAKQLTRMSTV